MRRKTGIFQRPATGTKNDEAAAAAVAPQKLTITIERRCLRWTSSAHRRRRSERHSLMHVPEFVFCISPTPNGASSLTVAMCTAWLKAVESGSVAVVVRHPGRTRELFPMATYTTTAAASVQHCRPRRFQNLQYSAHLPGIMYRGAN